MVKKFAVTAAVAASLGLTATAWGLSETRSFVLRRRSLIIDTPYSPHSDLQEFSSLRVLHLSDLHLLPHQRKKVEWVKKLKDTQPDLLVFTGDFIASPHALEPLLEALEIFQGIPGVFVFGSNDYYYPKPKNPFTYFFGPSSRKNSQKKPAELPWRDMREAFISYGWVDLNNSKAQVEAAGLTIECIGVDDPHLGFDRLPEAEQNAAQTKPGEGEKNADMRASSPHNLLEATIHSDGLANSEAGESAFSTIEKPRESTAEHPLKNAGRGANTQLKIGVAHAPYSRVLNAMADEGCSLIFAGHTHGGQVCLPGVGALVTNCDLPTRLVAGLYDWPAGVEVIRHDGGAIGPGPWVHVSAGLGTSPFAPVRVACRPEAILLDVKF